MTKIARIEPIPIEYPDPNDFGTIRRTVLVRVETTDGVVGWGECIAMWPEACKAVAVVISGGFEPLLKGDLAEDIDAAWVKMRRHVFWYGEGGIASMAISGIDMALWDIRGKVAGKPLVPAVRRREAGPDSGQCVCPCEQEGRGGLCGRG